MTESMEGADRGALLKWRQKVESLGFTDFVSPEDGFKTLELAPWNNAKATGIYCWFTENGEAYVGQAKAVRRRLLDHWKAHKDILAAAFRKTDEKKLDETEHDCIKEVAIEYPIRNIKHAPRTSTYVPLDSYLGEQESEAFLRGEAVWESQSWRSLELLEIKQRSKFRRFEIENQRLEILCALRLFIAKCIPNPARTENRFWSVSLYPGNAIRLIMGVNAGQQEILTIHAEEEDFYIVRPLCRKWFNVREFIEGPFYKTESLAYFVELQDFEEWLISDRIVAIRELVVWLMRHTTTLNNGSHCPQIVRAAFAAS